MILDRKLRNMKVKNKLNFFGGSMIGVILFLGIICIVASMLMNKQTKMITENWMPGLTYAKELDTMTSDYRLKQYGHLTATTPEQMEQYEAEIALLEEQIGNTREEMEQYLLLDEEKEMLAVIREEWAAYKEQSVAIIELSKKGETEKAGEMMTGEIKNVYEKFSETFEQLVTFEQKHADESAQKADSLFTVVIVIAVVMLSLSILLVVILARKVTGQITEPLGRIRKAMKKLYKDGDLNFSLEYEARDEFGELVEEINSFVSALVIIIRDEGMIMEEMAKGNFEVNSGARELYIGDFGQILVSMRGIREKLGNALSGISESANQVNGASEQMANEAQSLADGAATQAGEVGQVLETVEKVEDESRLNADQALHMSSRASEVMEKAEDSNRQMDEMVKEMELLTETSRQISSIIDAIENIASQTNLLSLNASIEAARAGEAGKGFAVVADEIGKLATQCSQSANTTRNLIETAIEQTQKGNGIARKTADALSAVAEGIEEISTLVEQVRKNCEHQSTALVQVDLGMERISKIVETNSASAQETSATSEELAAHAENLALLLADFRFSASTD